MEEKITRRFTKEDVDNKDFDCGILENILLQLKEPHKGVGVFNENAYVFGQFDSSTIHNRIYDDLGEDIEEYGEKRFSVSILIFETRIHVVPLRQCRDKEFETSAFEYAVLEQIRKEVKEAELKLPEGYTVTTDYMDEYIERRKKSDSEITKNFKKKVTGEDYIWKNPKSLFKRHEKRRD